jgi:lipid-binding SYLF domain-containing protein
MGLMMCGAVVMGVAHAEAAFKRPGNPAEWREYLRQRRTEALNDLYALRPGTKKEIESAYGYAVFSNFNMNLFLLSTANGRGVVVDNKTKKETFMKMFQGGIGVGFGAKDFRAVFVFSEKSTFEKFIKSGWQFGGQADAAAKTGDLGDATSGAIEVGPGLRVYLLTKNGLLLQATFNGTKYWVDKEVNEK